MASSQYWDDVDADRRKNGLKQALGPVIAVAWIGLVGSITYLGLLYTNILPEELRLAALDQMLNPEVEEEEDAEETLKLAGMDPENLAMMMMAAQALGQTPIGAAANDVLVEYDEEAFEMMQQIDLKGATIDYEALVSQMPADIIDASMTQDQALAELSAHAAYMAEMQSLMEEEGLYDGPIDGLEETGDVGSLVDMAESMADTAANTGDGTNMFEVDEMDGGMLATAMLAESLQDDGFLKNTSDQVKTMTEQALENLLDQQRYTVPMLDIDTMNLDKIRAYKTLAEDPERIFYGETEDSIQFVSSYMLPHTLLSDAIHFREAGETERALNALRLLFLAFPEHSMTGDALLLLSDIQDLQGESDASRRTLHTFLTVHGGHPRAVDGVIRFTDWQIASGDGVASACQWLHHVTAYPPAVQPHGLRALVKAAELRGCYPAAPLPDLVQLDDTAL